jgi:hypothetical protein
LENMKKLFEKIIRKKFENFDQKIEKRARSLERVLVSMLAPDSPR